MGQCGGLLGLTAISRYGTIVLVIFWTNVLESEPIRFDTMPIKCRLLRLFVRELQEQFDSELEDGVTRICVAGIEDVQVSVVTFSLERCSLSSPRTLQCAWNQTNLRFRTR